MTIVEMTDVLRDEIQEYLDGAEATLAKTVTDLTSRVERGKSTVKIPKLSGLSLADVPTDGSDQTAGGMAVSGDDLALDQAKEVPEYVTYTEDKDSAIELETAFLAAAPRVFAEGIEENIATQLSSSEYNDGGADDHEFNSGTASSFSIANIATAKKLLDKAKVPTSDRWLAVNADGMEILAGTSEFQEGQKSLSDEALKQGVVSQVKGFKVVQSEDVAATKVLCYHRTACAFALHDEMHYINHPIPQQGRTFLSLRGKYGSKRLDGGRRNVVITMAA